MNTLTRAAAVARCVFLSKLNESADVPLAKIADVVEQAGKPPEFDRVIIAIGKGKTEEELARIDFTSIDADGRPSVHSVTDRNLIISSFAWLTEYPTIAPRDLIVVVNLKGSEVTPGY